MEGHKPFKQKICSSKFVVVLHPPSAVVQESTSAVASAGLAAPDGSLRCGGSLRAARPGGRRLAAWGGCELKPTEDPQEDPRQSNQKHFVIFKKVFIIYEKDC